MKALVFNIQLNSLYSIRIPFTWQSALTYPVLPSSAIIGILANALQRYKNDKHPLEYLDNVEREILWAGSKLLSPCIIKSYITSAIVKWESNFPWKFTNALGRQFAYSRELQIAAIFKREILINDTLNALTTSPLTCGDSESPVSVKEIFIQNVDENIFEEEIKTSYPIPFDEETEIIEGGGKIYLMQERCKKHSEFTLKTYLVPLEEEEGILYPSCIKIKRKKEKIFQIKDIGYVVTISETKKEKRKKKSNEF